MLASLFARKEGKEIFKTVITLSKGATYEMYSHKEMHLLIILIGNDMIPNTAAQLELYYYLILIVAITVANRWINLLAALD